MTGLVTGAVTDSITTGSAASLGQVAVITLILFLVTKELASASDGPKPRILSQHALVGIVPLLIVFGLIVLVKAVEVLG